MSGSVTARVASGVAWLDEHQPGWDARINLDRLNLQSACDCVVGQLVGLLGFPDDAAWWEMLLRLGVQFHEETELGFNLTDEEESYEEQAWHDLTAEWKRVITERRSS